MSCITSGHDVSYDTRTSADVVAAPSFECLQINVLPDLPDCVISLRMHIFFSSRIQMSLPRSCLRPSQHEENSNMHICGKEAASSPCEESIQVREAASSP